MIGLPGKAQGIYGLFIVRRWREYQTAGLGDGYASGNPDSLGKFAEFLKLRGGFRFRYSLHDFFGADQA